MYHVGGMPQFSYSTIASLHDTLVVLFTKMLKNVIKRYIKNVTIWNKNINEQKIKCLKNMNALCTVCRKASLGKKGRQNR